MTYLLVDIEIRPGMLEQYHEHWAKNALPKWEKHGLKHIGTFNVLIGQDSCSHVHRLFAVENLDEWMKFMSDEYKLSPPVTEYIVRGVHLDLLNPAFYSPLK